MRPLILCLALLLVGCAATPPEPAATYAGTPVATAAPTLVTAAPTREAPSLVPPPGTAWFGMNLDWAGDSIEAVSDRLGATPSVWVEFVEFPIDDIGREHLGAFVERVGGAGGIGLLTLEPHGGLESVTPEAAREVAELLADAWNDHGVPTVVRFAHEMNGSWYPWGQQPDAYVAAYRIVADEVHAHAPASAMAWAPNEGSGYPFTGGAFTGDDPALDTDGDGAITAGDDPYAPYWPGADVVDWVGMSLYHWGIEYPWGENELPPSDSFRDLLTGGNGGVDFYATYADGHDKPIGIFETAALYNPAAPGPAEDEIKVAWWRQVFAPSIARDFPRLAMINWFEWRKHEPEVGGVVDWRISSDPALARALIDEAPDGWLRFGGLGD